MAELLKMLSETNGVSGNEKNVREIILRELSSVADDIRIDTMGNITALKKGAHSGIKTAVTANMDEAGFIISSVTDKGYLKFKPVGKIDPRKIISKRVVIGENGVKGIIGMKAIHLQTKSERENTVSVSKLFIDIGAKDKGSAQKRVKPGDYVTFDTKFGVMNGIVKGKALDRSGACAAVIEAMRGQYPCDVYAFFLAQSEVGARGAQIAARAVNPDAVLTVSSAETEDMYGCEEYRGGAVMDGGVIINYADKTVSADKKLTDSMAAAADKAKIKTQIRVLKASSSDTGELQRAGCGARCLNAAIPCRYSRSPVSLMSLDDIKSAADYISLFLNKIGEMV